MESGTVEKVKFFTRLIELLVDDLQEEVKKLRECHETSVGSTTEEEQGL